MTMKKEMRSLKPTSINIRSYQVGFGDCFLLSFMYDAPSKSRHVLIDFGSTGSPRGKTKTAEILRVIATHIAAVCKEENGSLDVVVATHRHKDHISGFDRSGGPGSSGEIIRSLKPSLVVQPWTEDPKAATDATAPTATKGLNALHVASLRSMQAIAEAALQSSQSCSGMLQKQLAFLGENNLANKSAVENLMTMGKRNKYVYFGQSSGIEKLLPGVGVRVLGPPTLEQTRTIEKQRARDPEEFWQLQAATIPFFTSGQRTLFPKAPRTRAIAPLERWFVDRMQNISKDSLLELVRILDNAMNNTSVILLFEVGGKKLLFPGDAQIENWAYALFGSDDHQEIQAALAEVDLYKVGHHGSLNATPKTLWELFKKRSKKKLPNRLHTLVSTMSGKHGDTKRGTEVPRRTLVEALEKETDFFSTQTIKATQDVWKWKPTDPIDDAKFCHLEKIILQ